jgi:hypothetical protein
VDVPVDIPLMCFIGFKNPWGIPVDVPAKIAVDIPVKTPFVSIDFKYWWNM